MNIINPRFDLFEAVTIVDYPENKKGLITRRLFDIDNEKYIYDIFIQSEDKYYMDFFQEEKLKK